VINDTWQDVQARFVNGRNWLGDAEARRWIASTSSGPRVSWKQLISWSSGSTVLSEIIEYRDPTEVLDQFGACATWPEVSEKTASQLYQTSLIARRLDELPSGHVIEVGAGFGNLARIMLETSPSILSWTILDIPGVLAAARDFLRQHLSPELFEKVIFASIYTDEPPVLKEKYDLFVSTFALSETPFDTIDLYSSLVISRSDRAWIIGQLEFVDGTKTMQRIIDRVRLTHDVRWAPYIYSFSEGWATAEMLAVRREDASAAPSAIGTLPYEAPPKRFFADALSEAARGQA